MYSTSSTSVVSSTLNFKSEILGPTATKFFPHPLDPNMGANFDGEIWTRYVKGRPGGVAGEWRQVTKFSQSRIYGKGAGGRARTSTTKDMVLLPNHFCRVIGKLSQRGMYKAGRFTLECYLGRPLESWEVCRHGIAGPNDHSYLNVSPGDAVNNMIDDLENGKSETNLTYLIQAQQRLARLISNITSTQPTNADETTR